MLTQVKINNIDVSSLLFNWQYEKSYGDILSEIVLKFPKTVNNLVTLETGLTLEVWRGWVLPTDEKIFDGYVEKLEPEGGLITITGIDQLWDTVRREVNLIYDSATHVSAGKLSAIFQDLINVYSSDVDAQGTNTTATDFKLIDATAGFVAAGIVAGDNVWNKNTNGWTTVVSVDSPTQLTLTANIFPNASGIGKYYVVKPVAAMIADSTSVQDSGTVYTINKFVCNHTDPFERCKKLADAISYQFYYRSDTNKVYFEPQGFTTNTNALTVGSNIIQIPKWQYDITEMVNNATYVGAYQEVETTESGQINVTAGYTTTGITLALEPISTKVYGDAGSPPTTLLVGGQVDSTAAYDYYVDKNRHMILPAPGTTFTINDFFEIRYSLAAPIPINMRNQASIDTYKEFAKTITLNDVRSVADAEVRGTQHLAKYSTPFIYATVKVKDVSTYGLAAGQQINVVDNISSPAVNQVLLINKIRIRYPADYVELDVGDKYWRLADFNAKVLEKFKRFEEDEFANQEIINDLVNVDNMSVSPIAIRNRYSQQQTQTITGTNLWVLGNPDYGKLGTACYGDTDMGAATNNFIQQFNNTYTEYFYDTDFKDAATTATWTTVSTCTFAAGQIAKSTSIDYNNGTITAATMTVTITSGTYNLEMTANGGTNWESCTNGVAHTFSNTGTDLRWRITENAGGAGVITKVVISSYH